MKLSIIIPMYNAKDTIGNCLESLMEQDLDKNDYEIIIIDDGSKDNSVAIVQEYIQQYPNIQLYKEVNSGCYSTRNKLLKLAKGDYIYNIDADDYIAHNCLSSLLKITENDIIDIIGFKTIETADLDKKEITEQIEIKDFKISSGKEFIEKHIRLRHEIWWYFIRREFLENHKMVFNKNEYNADVVFTLEALLNANKVAYLPIAIHRYVQTQNSLMRSKDFEIISKRLMYMQMMIVNKSKIINSIESKCNENNINLVKNLKHRRDVFVFFNVLNMIRNPFSVEHVKEKIKLFKTVDAYPLRNFRNKKYGSYLYRVLAVLVNKEPLLYAMVRFKNLFFKPSKNYAKKIMI